MFAINHRPQGHAKNTHHIHIYTLHQPAPPPGGDPAPTGHDPLGTLSAMRQRAARVAAPMEERKKAASDRQIRRVVVSRCGAASFSSSILCHKSRSLRADLIVMLPRRLQVAAGTVSANNNNREDWRVYFFVCSFISGWGGDSRNQLARYWIVSSEAWKACVWYFLFNNYMCFILNLTFYLCVCAVFIELLFRIVVCVTESTDDPYEVIYFIGRRIYIV